MKWILLLPSVMLLCLRTFSERYEFGRAYERVLPDGTGRQFVLSYVMEYGSEGNLVHYKDYDGNESWYEYDSGGRLACRTDSYGRKWRYEYDGEGRLCRLSNSRGYEARFEYDSEGNLAYKRDPLCEYWYEYDSRGNKTSRRNSKGFKSCYDYDSKGNEIHGKTSSGYEWWFEYDGNGCLTHERDSLGNERWYDYDRDSQGRVTAQFAADKDSRSSGMSKFDKDYVLLSMMESDDYFPKFLIQKVRDKILPLIALLEGGERDIEVIQAKLDEMTLAINGLAQDFVDNGSELETCARDSIGETVEYVLRWFKIGIDVETAIRLREW